MATVAKERYPFPEYEDFNGDFDAFIDASEEALNAIPKDRLFYVPFADSYAYYYVVSLRPLVLQHIPYGDAWELPAREIEELTAKKVQNTIDTSILFRKLYL